MPRAPAKPKAEHAPPAPAAQDTPPGQDTLTGQDAHPVDVPMLIVVGPAKGRWRIGRKFTTEPTALVLADLTEEEIAALQADPELSVISQMAAASAD